MQPSFHPLLIVGVLFANGARHARQHTWTTNAGQPGVSGSADGVGANAGLNTPHGIAVDRFGVVHVAYWNNHTIRKVTPARVVTTFVGQAGTSGTNDGPGGAAVASVGNLFVADAPNATVRNITPAGVTGSADGNGTSARSQFTSTGVVTTRAGLGIRTFRLRGENPDSTNASARRTLIPRLASKT